MLARLDRQEIAVACKIALPSHAIRKRKWIVEQEIFVAEDVEEKRQVARRNKPQGFGPRDVEQAKRRVERRREQGAWSPFKAVGLAGARIDDRAAVARQYEEYVVVEMMGPIRRACRRDS